MDDHEQYVLAKMKDMDRDIEHMILRTDNAEEMLMLASVLLNASKQIFDTQIGEANRRKVFADQ